MLGPVDVVGAAQPFRRAWTLDLVVYLSLHRRGVLNEVWATALWPDRLMAAPTLHSTVSAARRALGRTPDGRDPLPRRGGVLSLSPAALTDWEAFGDLADSPDPATWRRALSLVRGRPFEGLRSLDWTVLEGVGPALEEQIVRLAGTLAEHELSAGRSRSAVDAVRRGLLASPFDERLYRLLLRAADLEGNPAGVEAAMADLVRLVGGAGADAPDPACLHPDTLALYRSLTRRRGPGTGVAFARL